MTAPPALCALDVELATVRTWPAAHETELGGWRLLAAGGVTGRVNAVWPLAWNGTVALDAAIAAAGAWYAARNLPLRFKLTAGAAFPPALPEALAAHGLMPGPTRTLIMTRPLPADAAPARPVALHDVMPPAFDAALAAATPDAAELDERRAIARRAPKPSAFAVLNLDGAPCAVGMSACAGDLAGVFVMRTLEQARRKGLARDVLRALLGWAHGQGARAAFLQVEADNAPAVALYESEGFAALTSYCFWRRAT